MRDSLLRRDAMKRVGGGLLAATAALVAGCKTEEPPAEPPAEPKPPTEPKPPAEPKPPETKAPAEGKDTGIYVCGKCGYVYDPSKQTPPTPFADLPDTWTCPKCKSPKTMYKPKA